MIEAVETAPRLSQMILAAWQLGRAVAVELVQEVLQRRAQEPTPWPECPQCGRKLESKGFVRRQVQSLLGGIGWQRRVGRCPNRCRIGEVAPLDQELGLEPHQRTSVEVKQMACGLAVFVPFETVAVLLSWITGVPVSAKAVWGWVQVAGQRAMKHLQEELDQLAQGVRPKAEPLTAAMGQMPLLLGADGVMVPFRPKGGSPQGKRVWREVKVAVLARFESVVSRTGEVVTRLRQRRLVAVLGDIDALSERLWLEAVRQGVLTAPQVVWLSDGARGLWRLFSERFAGLATGILDFYHAAQHLWQGAAAWLDGRTKMARHWFAAARHRLRHGQHQRLLAELAQTLAADGLPASARETLTKLYAYLDAHRTHIDYARFKALGWPLGSGFIESACKWLVQQRFKGVGMRWSEDGFNHLLHLRVAWVNGRFDCLFQPVVASPN